MIPALLIKDRTWLLLISLVGFGLHLVTLLGLGAVEIWLLPSAQIHDIYVIGGFFGAVALGLFVALRDDVTRTREYLLFRPVSRLRIAVTTHLAWSAVLVLWVVPPLLLSLLGTVLLVDMGEPADTGRIFWHLVKGSMVFPCFAAGYFAGTFSRSWKQGLLLGLPILLILFALNVGFRFGGPRPILTLTLNIALTLILLYAAFQQEQAGHDADRPFQPRGVWLSQIVAGLSFVILFLTITSSIQGGILTAVVSRYPAILSRPDGTLALALQDVRRSGHYSVVDDFERQTGEKLTPDSEFSQRAQGGKLLFDPWTWSSRGRAPRKILFGKTYSMLWVDLNRDTYALLNHGTGLVDLYQPRSNDDSRVRVISLGKSVEQQQRPFSTDVRLLVSSRDLLVLLDPGDTNAWTYDLNDGGSAFTALPFPNTATIAGTEDRLARITTPDVLEGEVRRTLVVATDKGVFRFRDGRFDLVDPQSPEVQIQVVRHGAAQLVATVTVGRHSLTHRYSPQGSRADVLMGAASAITLLNAPALTVASGLTHNDQQRRSVIRDPLVVGGQRPFLLAAALAGGVGLALIAHRRLTRLGASRARALTWALLVVLGGLPVFLFYRLSETRRAWRWAAAPAPSSSLPLVRNLTAAS